MLVLSMEKLDRFNSRFKIKGIVTDIYIYASVIHGKIGPFQLEI